MPRRKSSAPQLDPLARYPMWMFDVLKAVKEGREFERTFPAKNFAVNARQRYHQWRIALIELKFPKAGMLTEMACSGPFENPDGTATLRWTFTGDLSEHREPEMQLPEPYAPMPGFPKGSDYIKKQEGEIKGDKLEDTLKGWLNKEPKTEPANKQPLNIPSLDTSSKGVEIPACPPHDFGVDNQEPKCLKCPQPNLELLK